MIALEELERIAQAAFSYSLTGMAAFDAEIKFGQTFTPAGVLELITELRTLRARLEIDTSHSADGIDARDATIRGLEEEVRALSLSKLTGDAPKRAVTLELEMQADTPRDLASALYNFSIQIDLREVAISGVSGGCHAGYTYTYTANDAPSHDEYFAAVNVWLESRKAHPKEGV